MTNSNATIFSPKQTYTLHFKTQNAQYFKKVAYQKLIKI